MQIKGRVAFTSPLTRETPPGKAERERKMPPRDTGYCKIGWHKGYVRVAYAVKESF